MASILASPHSKGGLIYEGIFKLVIYNAETGKPLSPTLAEDFDFAHCFEDGRAPS